MMVNWYFFPVTLYIIISVGGILNKPANFNLEKPIPQQLQFNQSTLVSTVFILKINILVGYPS